MTLDLDPIKARLDAATPGEWERNKFAAQRLQNIVVQNEGATKYVATYLYPDDADLIAHAPADLRALVAEVERLRAELAAYQQSTPTHSTHYSGCYDSGPRHYECALAEIKRLREIVGQYHEATKNFCEYCVNQDTESIQVCNECMALETNDGDMPNWKPIFGAEDYANA